MQNSIWKLTALAGVIGIGFLIALQTLSSLDKEKPVVDNDSTTEAVAANGLQDNATGLWQSQSEPAQEPAPLRTQRSGDVRLIKNDPSTDDSMNQRAGGSQFDAVEGQRRRSAATEPNEFSPNSRARALPEFEANNEPSFVSRNREPAIEGGSRESAKAQALRLMKEAREAIDDGQLQTAHALATEALDLPVVYNQFEERPIQIIEEIEGLMKAKNRKPTARNPLEEEIERPDPLAQFKSTGTEKSNEPPELKSDVTDDLFAEKPAAEPKKAAKEEAFEDVPFEPRRSKSEPPRMKTDEELPLPDLEETERPAPQPRRQPVESDPPRLSLDNDEPPRLSLTDDEPLSKPLRKQVDEPQTKLVIRKDAPTTARLGEAMIYSMSVENRGSVNAAEVSVEDEVPQGCELVGSSPQAEQSGKKLIWKLGRIEAGKSKVIRVKVIPREIGNIGTVARVISVAEASSDVVPMSREEIRPSSASKLRLNVTAPQTAQLGEMVTVKFKFTNTGDQPISDINLQNLIPAGFQHVDGNDLSYPLPVLAARESHEAELELKAVRAGRFVNRSILSASGRAQTETETRIEILDPRGLRVETSEAASMPIGQPTVQEIRVINESSIAATGVMISDELPADLKFVKASSGGQYDAVTRKVHWKLDSIPGGETALLKLTVQPKTAGPHSCVIDVVQSGQRKADRVESRVKARGIAGLKVDLDHSAASILTGEEFTVEVRIRNRGNGADSNVNLNLLLPSELEFVQSRGPRRNRQPEIGQGQVKLISFEAIPEVGERAESVFEITLRAKAPGKAKMRAEVTSDELPETISVDSVIVVLDGTP